jgi:hypothetical protein
MGDQSNGNAADLNQSKDEKDSRGQGVKVSSERHGKYTP